jgi:membrane-bound metal-dependent hydrolase YbcI (DUF457 family)
VDNLTHTLVGLTVVRAGLGRRTPGALAAMLVATNAPDLDIIVAITDGAVPYLAAHRGWSHGPLGIVAIGVVVGLIVTVAAFRTRRAAEERRSPVALMGVALVGALLHVLLDLPTSYGTRLLSPFDATWFAVDWMPIIDVYVWALLLGGLIVARLGPERRMTVARVTLALVATVYGVRAVAHGRALELATHAGADGVVSRCLDAPVLTRHPARLEPAPATGACLQAAAIPTFFSPFRWVLIRQYAGGYELRDISLFAPARVDRLWKATEHGAAIDAAQHAETTRVFLDFSRLPAAQTTTLPDGSRRVRFVDVRFLRGPLSFYRDRETHPPFIATVVLAPDGAVVQQRLGD